MIMSKKTIGIIGGMGPMATVDLFRKIVENTAACSDAGHIHILIDNYPQIPDRSAAILQGSDDPVSYILQAADRLIKAGAELLLIPCNTTHYYYDKLAQSLPVPVLNMLQITARKLRQEGIQRVGLLATDGVLRTQVYEKAFAAEGIGVLCPDPQQQKKVMDMIYCQIKAGKPADRAPVEEVMDALRAQGAQRIVLGCTELPLVFCPAVADDIVDPTCLLALEAISCAGYETVKTKE